MDSLFLTLIKCFYIIYIMCFFKTVYSIAHPMSKFNNKIFKHPIGIKKIPTNMICPFGKIMSIIASFFLIFRYLFIDDTRFRKYYLKYHKYLIYIMIILCLINFNALLYMAPIFYLELNLILT